MNNEIYFIPERDEELYRAYKEALSDRSVTSQRMAVERAIATPTSRFWISVPRAYRYILRLKKGKPLGDQRDVRHEMMMEIYERYRRLEGRREFKGSSVYFITSFAVFQEAPGFYISYSRALSIVSRINRERRNARKSK